MKKVFVVLGALVLLLLIVILLPFLIDLNAYQARYLPILEESLNRKVTVEDLRLTLIPRIGVHISGFTVMDDPLFSTGPFARLGSLDLGVKLQPLLSGRVEIDEIIMRDPAITVIKNSLGLLNVSTLGKKTSQQLGKPPVPSPGSERLQMWSLLAADRVSLSNGEVTYRDRSSAKPAEYSLDKFQVLLQGVGLGHTPVIHVSGTLQPLNLPLKVDGTLGPLQENLDIGTFVFDVLLGKAFADIKGRAVGGNVHFTVSSPEITTTELPFLLSLSRPLQLKNLHMAGEVKDASVNIGALDLLIPLGKDTITVGGSVIGGKVKLKLTAPVITTTELPFGLSLTRPIEGTNLIALVELKESHARLQNLSLNLFGGQMKADAEVLMGAAPVPFIAKIAVERFQLGPLLEAVGTDRVSVRGTGSAQLDMHGKGLALPEFTAQLEGAGRLIIKDGKLEGINLLKEATALLNAIGITKDFGNETIFSVIESDLIIRHGVVVIKHLIGNSPDFDVAGSGTIAFDKTLNAHLYVILSEALTKSIVGSSPVGKALIARGRLSVPMVISGTIQAPQYALDTMALGRKVQEQVTEILGEVLKDQSGEDILRQGEKTLKKLLEQ
jgi:AsmA protein